MLATIAVSTALALWTTAWLALLGRFWYLRNMFEIRARSPALVLVAMLNCFIFSSSVLWHWLLRSMGKTMPCYITFILSYSSLAFAVTPYFSRTIRVVVAYHRGFRERYAKFVKWTPLMGLWAFTTAVYVVRSALFYGTNAEHYGDARECFYWDDLVCLATAVFVGGTAMFFLARRLITVNDAFNLKEEFGLTIGISCIFAGTIFIFQVLVKFKLIEDTPNLHITGEVLVLLWGSNAVWWSLFVPLVSYQKSARTTSVVVPVECGSDVEMVSSMAGALPIARAGGEMGDLFGQFCRKHLCMESWDFIVEVCKYEQLASSPPDDQFNAFAAILDQFLLPTSPNEINISSAMNKRLMSFKTREKFRSLNDDARRTTFEEAVAEVARMLDQNLLLKFQKHIVSKKETDLAEAAKGDRELMDLVRASSLRSAATSTRS